MATVHPTLNNEDYTQSNCCVLPLYNANCTITRSLEIAKASPRSKAGSQREKSSENSARYLRAKSVPK
ncbi:hypothetical protein OIDMADRAFT_20616 [Oidiodendron maius Zn]|uniref:Uncharacterized protein n=1 Tax=Oidiodendron maius (strain Zn) TaxID=913774 RepID=A0A0C3H565_OIDMZ|nr:hypothetical protein OIDMADRAFT_20616 [Oidiodendron maius Zn]